MSLSDGDPQYGRETRFQLEELLKSCILASSTISSENVELFVGGGLLGFLLLTLKIKK